MFTGKSGQLEAVLLKTPHVHFMISSCVRLAPGWALTEVSFDPLQVGVEALFARLWENFMSLFLASTFYFKSHACSEPVVYKNICDLTNTPTD